MTHTALPKSVFVASLVKFHKANMPLSKAGLSLVHVATWISDAQGDFGKALDTLPSTSHLCYNGTILVNAPSLAYAQDRGKSPP